MSQSCDVGPTVLHPEDQRVKPFADGSTKAELSPLLFEDPLCFFWLEFMTSRTVVPCLTN